MSQGRASRWRGNGRRALVTAVAGAVLVTTGAAMAPTAVAAPAPAPKKAVADVKDVSADKTVQQRRTSMSAGERAAFRTAAAKAAAANRTLGKTKADGGATGTPVGGEKVWLGLDDTTGGYFPATYVLRAVGKNIEVWVQKDTNYPQGDCRNDGVRNVVTDTQVKSLVKEYDSNMLPKESKLFSVAPPRDGTKEVDVGFGDTLANILGKDPNYFKGDGNKTVTLVSNVRDANYYDPTSPDGATYIAGFFSPLYNAGFDRNVMTIDSYDWLHRTGANPPDEGNGGLCSSKQQARPRLYEGTFAHEYQHLLESYVDADEVTWLNEGLSDYAQTAVGYVDTTLRYPATGADSHIACFEGWYGTADFPYCGAEQSLTRWEDQGSPSILSDYGAAYSFLSYVQSQFGDGAITYLHRNGANGLASLQNYLDDHAPGLNAQDVVHDWAAAEALDGFLDDGAKGLTKDQKARFSASKLHGGIDWAWTGSYDSPGAPTNGNDYVLGRTSRPLNGNTVGAMSFSGAKTYTPDPLAWVSKNGALYGGEGNDLDRTAVYQVKVPSGAPKLSLDTKYDIEKGWDFGTVQVSTDGGASYTSLSNADTTSTHDPSADPRVVAQLPGFTGTQASFKTETFDLSKYAGKTIYLSFRYLTDAATNGNGGEGATGWWVKNVKVGSTVVTTGASTAGAKSATQVHPLAVAGWSVQVVGWSLDGKRVAYREVKVGKGYTASLSKAQMRAAFKHADRIGVIVGADDESETVTKYANYTLKLNGTVQPGGSGDTTTMRKPTSRQLNFG